MMGDQQVRRITTSSFCFSFRNFLLILFVLLETGCFDPVCPRPRVQLCLLLVLAALPRPSVAVARAQLPPRLSPGEVGRHHRLPPLGGLRHLGQPQGVSAGGEGHPNQGDVGALQHLGHQGPLPVRSGEGRHHGLVPGREVTSFVRFARQRTSLTASQQSWQHLNMLKYSLMAVFGKMKRRKKRMKKQIRRGMLTRRLRAKWRNLSSMKSFASSCEL